MLLPEISFGYVVPKSGDFYHQSILSRFINYTFFYGLIINIFMFVVFLSYLTLFTKAPKQLSKLFVCMFISLSLFLPLTASLTYGSYLSILIFVLTGSIALDFIIKNQKEVNLVSLKVIIIFFIFLTSIVAIIPHTEEKNTLEPNSSVNSGVMSSGLYLNYINADYVYGDQSALNRKMSIYTDSVIFRVSPVHYLLLPNVENIFIYEKYTIKFDLTLFTSNPDELFVYEGSLLSMRYTFDEIPKKDIEANNKWFNIFQLSYYIHYNLDYTSPIMMSDLSESNFEIYSNEDTKIFVL